jgi:polysaccharide chain length determinant protein (PEP-CTERM system associated)
VIETQETQEIKTSPVPLIVQVIDIANRRKALIASCILTALTIGLGAYITQPKVFQSDSLLSYQQQMVDTGRMLPDDKSRLRDVVSTLTQIVTSRTSLEKIITDENLYEKERETLPMEDVIDKMRKDIKIVPSRNGDTFVISYMGNKPDKVAKVANALAARFIGENMKYREERASETSAYTQEELNLAKKMLDTKEAVMRDYKLKYFNEMADQRVTNMTRLIALQDSYQKREESIQNLEQMYAMLRDQISTRKELLEAKQAILNSTDTDSSQMLSSAEQLVQLRAELQSMELKYQKKHPEIKFLENKIARLEKSALTDPGAESSPNKSNSFDLTDKTLAGLQNQLQDISANITNIKKEKEDIQKLIDQYDKWIAAAPVREAEWSALTREYGEIKRHYDFLVGQNLQAGSALNLERKQRGSQFKVEDFAQAPVKPVKPNFLKIMGVALLLGCGASAAGSFLLEKLNTSFRFPEQLEAAFPFEVLCSVPRLPLKKELVRQRIWTIFGTATFLLWAVVLVAALGIFWNKGQIII